MFQNMFGEQFNLNTCWEIRKKPEFNFFFWEKALNFVYLVNHCICIICVTMLICRHICYKGSIVGTGVCCKALYSGSGQVVRSENG